jgi:ArsR family transcriptional regulator
MSNSLIIDSERFAGCFRALSNPHRLRLFLRLAACLPEGGTCADEDMRRCVGDLGKDLGVAASTVSHHLKELRQAGLIHMERKGQSIECWVEPDTLRMLSEFFEIAPCCERGEAK